MALSGIETKEAEEQNAIHFCLFRLSVLVFRCRFFSSDFHLEMGSCLRRQQKILYIWFRYDIFPARCFSHSKSKAVQMRSTHTVYARQYSNP